MAVLFVLAFALFFGQVWTGTGDEYANESRIHGLRRRQSLKEGGKSFNKMDAAINKKLAKLQEKLDKQLQPSNMWDTKSKGVQPKSNLTHKVCSDYICGSCFKYRDPDQLE